MTVDGLHGEEEEIKACCSACVSASLYSLKKWMEFKISSPQQVKQRVADRSRVDQMPPTPHTDLGPVQCVCVCVSGADLREEWERGDKLEPRKRSVCV